MKIKLAASCIVAAALLLPIAGYGADSIVASPKEFVKDSVITTKIKTKLADEKLSSLVKISVDTDDKGMVNLGGTAPNQAAADKAASIARGVEGVKSVDSHITIAADK
jgi:hyperosmotically inducible protein